MRWCHEGLHGVPAPRRLSRLWTVRVGLHRPGEPPATRGPALSTELPAAAATLSYAPADWDQDAFEAFAEGRDPAPCPACGRAGFFGPRVVGVAKHRACRFCGFYQEAGETPVRARPTSHGCPEWPEIARAPYIWWVPPDEDGYTCSFCGEKVIADEHLVGVPADDPSHPWWKVPQGKNRFYYARFWENWPFTKGRTFL